MDRAHARRRVGLVHVRRAARRCAVVPVLLSALLDERPTVAQCSTSPQLRVGRLQPFGRLADEQDERHVTSLTCRLPATCCAAKSGRPCTTEGAGVASFDGSSGDRVHSRRRVLGWAAAVAGLATGVRVAAASAAPSAPTEPIVRRGATRSVPEPAAARVGQVLGAKARTNTVALTIDDGPDPTWTPKVLDLLAANGVHATFSLIGRQAQAYPTLVRRIVSAGHGVCNHSMTHPQPFGARPTAAIRQQIVGAQAVISDAAGAPPRLFRAPGGDWTPAVLDLTAELGLTPVGWSVDPRDWALPGIPAIQTSLLAGHGGGHPADPRRGREPGPDRGRAAGGASPPSGRGAALRGAVSTTTDVGVQPLSEREVAVPRGAPGGPASRWSSTHVGRSQVSVDSASRRPHSPALRSDR